MDPTKSCCAQTLVDVARAAEAEDHFVARNARGRCNFSANMGKVASIGEWNLSLHLRAAHPAKTRTADLKN